MERVNLIIEEMYSALQEATGIEIEAPGVKWFTVYSEPCCQDPQRVVIVSTI